MKLESFKQRLPDYLALIRFDRPIGTLLLLWPTLWALWLAAGGLPSFKNLLIFSLGVFLMRSAGCAINDFADRNVDGRVKRTSQRPMATGRVSPREAVLLFLVLCLTAFILVLFTNRLTVYLSFAGAALAFCYPFMKRYTHLPQIVLGAAFSWAIPMAFAAETNSLPPQLWTLYVANVLWTVVYDTFYAMVDRDDDLKIGVKSTAVLFGDMDIPITFSLQIMVIVALLMTGANFDRGLFYFLGVAIAAMLFLRQQHMIRFREREQCFKAFLQNNRVGWVIFIGLVLDYHLPLSQ